MIRISPAARWAVTPKTFEVSNVVMSPLSARRIPINSRPAAARPSRSPHRDENLRAESGRVVAVFAVFLLVIFGTAAFVVDLGRAYFVDRSIQASVDAAALAGALELPDNTTAVTVAQQYRGRPGGKDERGSVPGVAPTAATECRAGWPCTPGNAVVVEQITDVPTFFARVPGVDPIPVDAHTVAVVYFREGPYAIFAYDSDCGGFGFKFNGGDLNIAGAIRSNGDFEVNGENIHADFASAHGTPCDTDIDGDPVDFGGHDEPYYDPSLHPWPRWYEESDFTCTYTATKFEFNSDGLAIPDGVYCASELFMIDGNNNSGNITVLAPEIAVNGNGHYFRPVALDLLFFATGDKEMILTGYGYDWEGVIFHPGGRVKINGDETSVLSGMIEALEVEVDGSQFNMNGQGPGAGGKLIRLIE